MHIPDLIPVGDALRAVGWLAGNEPFPTGEMEARLYRKLAEFCARPWHPPAAPTTAGVHLCELCQFDGPTTNSEIYVPGSGVIYYAPVAIAHYAAAHRYLPPLEFLDALAASSMPNSMEYKKALLANGGRDLLRASPT